MGMDRRVSLLIAIVAGLALLKLLVMWLEPRMAFYPVEGVQQTPAAMSLSYADLRIQTVDGETLHGWWLEHPQPRAQVVFWHGNGGNVALWLEVIAGMRRRGFSVLAVDYRGYGVSTGTPTEQGLYRDASAAVQEFQRRLRRPDVPVIYWGRSIGAPVAASSVAGSEPDGLILESPMPDARSILRDNPVLWGLSFLSSYTFSTSRFLTQYSGPLLVIHGDRDSIIPYRAGKRVFDDAGTTRKTLATIAGADHNDLHLVNAGEYWKAVDAFVELVGQGGR